MSDIPFYRTQMGQRFYEGTVPSLVRELSRLNANLERLVTTAERGQTPSADDRQPPEPEKQP